MLSQAAHKFGEKVYDRRFTKHTRFSTRHQNDKASRRGLDDQIGMKATCGVLLLLIECLLICRADRLPRSARSTRNLAVGSMGNSTAMPTGSGKSQKISTVGKKSSSKGSSKKGSSSSASSKKSSQSSGKRGSSGKKSMSGKGKKGKRGKGKGKGKGNGNGGGEPTGVPTVSPGQSK